jgi:plastocyanin
MSGKALLAIVVIIIIVLAFFVFRDGTTQVDPLDDPIEDTGLGANQSVPAGESDATPPVGDTVMADVAAVVTYTNDGFDPSVVSVENGEAVRFVNNSTRDMWVASANHPTHTVYPEKTGNDCLGSSFDACEGVPSGDSWEFTFKSAGDWGYHDHLRSNMTGVVTVQ